jgi:capsid assembly protease
LSITLTRIAEALSRPLLMHPTKAEIILSIFDGGLGRLGADDFPTLAEIEKAIPDASRFLGRQEGGRSYSSMDGIAIIPIVGSLANRGAYIGASSGIVSYEGLAVQLRQAASDTSIHSILLDIDSPGGEATGMFRLAALIRQVRETKRVVAFVDDMAASAGYGIASQAHEIVVSPTSIVGSIGVVLTHIDRSGEMEKAGRKVTLIHAGANKVDGHPFGPLSEQVKADLQKEVVAFYEQFVATVVAGRLGLTPDAVKETEARTYLGQEAIDRGLADRIATIDEVVADLRKRNTTPASHQPKGPAAMSDKSTNAPSASYSDGFHAGIKSANDRISEILADPRAQGREMEAVKAAIASPYQPALAVLDVLVAADTDRLSGLRAAIDARITPSTSKHRTSLSAAIDEQIQRAPSHRHGF